MVTFRKKNVGPTCRVEELSCVISGFRREADEICAVLGYYTGRGGNSFQTFRDKLTVPSSRVKKSFMTLEDVTDRFSSQNFDK